MGKYFKRVESEWYIGIRFYNPHDSNEKGVTYKETKTAYVTLLHIESESDLYEVLEHEGIHVGIADEVGDKMPDESQNMDGEQEHEAIRRMCWARNDWIF